LSENSNNKFTFSVEGKEYVINEKDGLKKKNKNTIHGPSIAVGAAITAICVIVVFSLNLDNTDEQKLIEREIIETEVNMQPVEISLSTLINNGSPILGNPNAPITLIEFGDFQCHFCNVHFHNTEPALLENFVAVGKVNIIFKDYTIIGKDSVGAAHGTHCAKEQNKYWEYHSILYNNWAGENNGWAGPQNLLKYANDIQLDSKLFTECMDSQRYYENIKQSTIDAETLGISGTPAFFILDKKNNNLQIISGAQPYESFERVFNSILEK
jgi:protein-disulfide isomerase